MSVKVENLVKIYGKQRAVDQISFTAEKGEILGFLGPNGAGKSTTMKIATCYIPPTEGDVEVGGHSVLKNPNEVKKNIGYLPEHNPLYLDMFVHEYLRFIGEIYGMKGKRLKNRTAEMIELCGLTREQTKQIGMLSKGYRQRVGLAQALIHDPEVLILDEPTTGLDPNQLVEIRNLIKAVSPNKTVILSTHIMQEVQALCDRVVIINQGKIVANDTVSVLTSSGNEVIIELELAENVTEEEFLSVEEIKSVSISGQKIILKSETDIRPIIFKLVQEKGWNLLELKKIESSIENVFQNLTKK